MLRNYISRICLVLIVSFFSLWAIYGVIIYSNKKYIPIVKHNEYLFNGKTIQYDALLLGTSRMKNLLNPDMIDSITGLHSYNAGVGGSSAVEADMILKAYVLHNPPPKYVFITADVILICTNRVLTAPSSYLSCDNIGPIRDGLKEYGMPVSLYHFLPFLKLTEMVDYNRIAPVYMVLDLASRKKAKIESWNGFINNIYTVIRHDKPNGVKYYNIATRCVKALDNIIATCKEHNIKLVFVYAPEYKHYYTGNITNLKEVMDVYYKRAYQNNIQFLRYDSLDMCTNPLLFKDNSHLNAAGAALYSTYFARDILQKGIIHRP